MKHPISQLGLDNLRKRLSALQQEMLHTLDALATAASQGDLSENAAYHAAKSHKVFLNKEISSISEKINNSYVVTSSKPDTVSFGSTVHLFSDNAEIIYTIVGAFESSLADGKLGYNSPLASALIGKKTGELIELDLPNGSYREYKIIKIC